MKKYLTAAAEQLLTNKSLLAILCIEFVVMISCFSICFGSLQTYSIRRQMYKDNHMDSFYYFRPYVETSMEDYDIDLDIMTFGYTRNMDMNTQILLYSRSALENIDIMLSKGEAIDLSKDYGSSVPCYITSELAKRYDVGQSYDIKTGSDIYIGKFYICGVIKNDVIFSPTYAFDYDTTCFIAYDEKGLIKKDSEYIEFYAVDPEGEGDFEERYSEYISEGILQPFSEYYASRNELERRTILPYVALALTFAALSVSGLLSYNVVSLEALKRQIGIYYLCGGSLGRIMLIFFLKNLLIVAVPSLISILVISEIQNSELAQTTLISWNGYFLAVFLCLLGLIAFSFLSVIRINRRRIVNSLKSS